jgi:hypothetical protein
MYDLEDDEVEEEAVLGELDGKEKARRFLSGSDVVFQPKRKKMRKKFKAKKTMKCLNSSRMEVKTLNSLSGSKGTVRTSYAVTTSGCFDIPETGTKSGIVRPLGTLPAQRGRNLILRRWADVSDIERGSL